MAAILDMQISRFSNKVIHLCSEKNCDNRINIGECRVFTSICKKGPGRQSWICKLAETGVITSVFRIYFMKVGCILATIERLHQFVRKGHLGHTCKVCNFRIKPE